MQVWRYRSLLLLLLSRHGGRKEEFGIVTIAATGVVGRWIELLRHRKEIRCCAATFGLVSVGLLGVFRVKRVDGGATGVRGERLVCCGEVVVVGVAGCHDGGRGEAAPGADAQFGWVIDRWIHIHAGGGHGRGECAGGGLRLGLIP